MSNPIPSSSATYKRLLKQILPYKGYFLVGILAMILLGATEAGIPAGLKPLLDGTFVDKDPSYLFWAPLGIVILFSSRGLFSIISQITFTKISTQLVLDLRQQMFQRLMGLPTTFYDQNISGKLISKLVYDVTQVTQAGTQVLTVLVKDSVTVIALVAYLFWLDWKLSILILVLIPIITTVAHLIGKRIRILNRQLQLFFGEMTHVLEESIKGHKVIKIFGGQKYESRRFGQTAKNIKNHQFKHAVAASIGVPIVELSGAIVLALVVYLGTTKTDPLSVGEFVAFFAALGLLFSPIKRLTKVNDPLQRGLAAAESVFELLDQHPEEDLGTFEKERADGEITFNNVTLKYPNTNKNALGPINLTIAPQSTIALVGASGSGKTTLANLIPRIYSSSTGEIHLDGINLNTWSLTALRSQISYVSQDVVLFNDSVANNIAYGDEQDRKGIENAAKIAGATEFIKSMPEGLDTVIGENGVRLSGGQRQRLAIARAIYANTPLLILDEATSALDNKSEAIVKNALEQLRNGRTTIIIAHRLSTIQSAERILVLNEGQIVEDGTHETLIVQNGYYASLINSHEFDEETAN